MPQPPLVVGAHLRNEVALKQADTTLYTSMKGEGVLAFWYQDPAAVIALCGSAEKVICRLPNSFDDNHILGLDRLRASYQESINRFYAAGVRIFVLDNEPNESWVTVNPPSGKTPQWFWAWLMRRVLLGVAIPSDITLLLTPISMPTLNSAWVDEMYVSEPGIPSVASYCSAAAAHCYWQAEVDMDASWAGRSYQWLHNRTGLPVYITEAGCSTVHDSENRQAHDYPIYCHKVGADSYVMGLYFFILGSNGKWTLFELTQKVSGAIGAR